MSPYVQWSLDPVDKQAVLAYTHRYLEMLTAYCPPASHWVLKSPMYSFYPAELLAEFPDVRVVVTHRDPRVVIPSIARLMTSMSVSFYEDYSLDQREIGATSLDVWIQTCTRLLDYRQQHPEHDAQFFDVIYDDFIAHPIPTIRALYQHFDLPFTPAFEEKMQEHLAKDPRVSHGRHSYSLEEFGLTRAQIQQAAPAYFARYFATTS
jgi:hypothetical protein